MKKFLSGAVILITIIACQMPLDIMSDNTGGDQTPARSATSSSSVTIFSEDFEVSDLLIRGWTGDLNRHDRWATTTSKSHSGSWSANYDCYGSGTLGDMISPVIDLSGTTDNYLSFWVLEPERSWWWSNYFNHLYVYVSNDNGSTWTMMDHMYDMDNWTLKSYRIDDFVVPTSTVKIKFVGQGGNADDDDYDTFLDDLSITGTPVTVSDPARPSNMDILKYWAPQVYHDTRDDTVLGYRFYESQDMISKVNFDGDWLATNNWENFPRNGDYSSLAAYAYSSFVETETHYFLGYQYFHATDDAVIEADRHENDMEDVYICVEKSSNSYEFGTFKAMITNRHGDMQQYAAGDLLFNSSHPKIFISSNGDVINGSGDTGAHGHGIEKYNPGDHDVGDDGIIYNVADKGEAPTVCGGGAFTHAYDYGLVDINELWHQRYLYDTGLFYKYDSFAAEGQDTGAHAPWGDQYFNDPAHYFKNQSTFSFLNNEPYSTTYLYNPYYGVTSTEGSGSPVHSLPTGWSASNIGNPSLDGSEYQLNGTYVLDGAGTGLSGNSDQFNIVYKQLEGDGEVVVKIYSIQEDIDDWAKAGIMIRDSLSADSAFVMAGVTPANGAIFQHRSQSSENSSYSAASSVSTPLWVRLVRSSGTITAYYGSDGSTWTYLNSTSDSLGNLVYAGLTVTSSNTAKLCSATFDKVTVSE